MRKYDRQFGDHIEASRAFTGRVNLFTRATGLLTYPSDHLQAFNRVDESITLAALPPFTPVVDGQMVATLKIIPFAIAARNLDIARSVAKHGAAALFNVVPFKPHRAGLIQTRLPGTKDSVLDKTRAVTAARLGALNSQIVDDRVADHTSAAVAAAMSSDDIVCKRSATTARRGAEAYARPSPGGWRARNSAVGFFLRVDDRASGQRLHVGHARAAFQVEGVHFPERRHVRHARAAKQNDAVLPAAPPRLQLGRAGGG